MLPRDSLAHLPAPEALKQLGLFIDAAGDTGHRQALNHALALAATIRPQCSAADVPMLDYYEANVWSCLRHLNRKEGQDMWDWQQPELENEVMGFRRALNGSAQLPLDSQLPVLTNLGNIMSHLGRQVEAIAYYDRAMALYPNYSMTLGNRGLAFTTYSVHHYDEGHKRVFLARARDDFTAALKYQGEPGAHEAFRAKLAEFDERKLMQSLSCFDRRARQRAIRIRGPLREVVDVRQSRARRRAPKWIHHRWPRFTRKFFGRLGRRQVGVASHEGQVMQNEIGIDFSRKFLRRRDLVKPVAQIDLRMVALHKFAIAWGHLRERRATGGKKQVCSEEAYRCEIKRQKVEGNIEGRPKSRLQPCDKAHEKGHSR